MMDLTLPAERWETLGARKMAAVKNQTAVQKTTKHFDQYTKVSAHGEPKKNIGAKEFAHGFERQVPQP